MTSPLRLKHVARVIAGQSPPSEAVADLADGLPFLQGNAEFGATSPSARYESDNAPKRCTQGDVLLSVRAPVGALNIADRDYGIGRGLCAIRAVAVVPRFLWWWAHTQVVTLNSVATGSTYTAVSADDVGNLLVPNVPLDEQRRIADFLDTETARIDALVAHRSRQRDLLDLSESSLLASASDVRAPRMPVKRVASRITSGPRGWGELATDNGTAFLRITNVPRRGIELLTGDVLLVDAPPGPERERTRTREGDVLVTITADIGSVGIVRRAFTDANVNQHIALVRPDRSKVIPEWLAWQLKAPRTREVLTGNAYGGTKVGLGLVDIANVAVPVPSLNEQAAHLDELNRRLGFNEDMRGAVSRQAALLVERRRALITAAVTGQLDVTTARGGRS